MASYIESSLMPGEEIFYKGRISVWSLIFYVVPTLFLGLCAIGALFSGALSICLLFLVLGCVPLFFAYLRYNSIECALTNKRIIAKFGFVRRTTIDLDLRKTESIRLEQSILGRIFNYGSIVVSGAGNPQAPVPGISSPMDFRKAFLAIQERVNRHLISS
jgi:uncharacterized membrane protein YdbT with pleckstrin-like domain